MANMGFCVGSMPAGKLIAGASVAAIVGCIPFVSKEGIVLAA